jgi:hypothetical protein
MIEITLKCDKPGCGETETLPPVVCKLISYKAFKKTLLRAKWVIAEGKHGEALLCTSCAKEWERLKKRKKTEAGSEFFGDRK